MNRGGVTMMVPGAKKLIEDSEESAPASVSQACEQEERMINHTTTKKVRDNFTPATAGQRYLRVRVNSAP